MEIESNQMALFREFIQEQREKKTPPDNCLKEQLEKLMKEKGVTQGQIHKATGIPYSTLGDMCNGKHRYQKLNRNILELARFFNVSIDYLAFGEGEKNGTII